MRGSFEVWRQFRRKRSAVLGLCLLIAICIIAAAAPLLFPGDPGELVAPPLLWPGQDSAFPLGSDPLGRDVAAGIFHGAGTALMIGGISTGVALAIGMTVGALAGYYGGWINDVLMRITEMFQTMPQFILAVVLVAIFTPSVATIVTALALVSWPPVARLVRAEFLSLREREFVQSCRAIGMSERAIILTQILPELPDTDHRHRLDHRGERHPDRGGAVLPRSWRPQCRDLGRDDRSRPRQPAHRMVPRHDSGTRHPGDRSVPQPRRRRAERRAQSEAAEQSMSVRPSAPDRALLEVEGLSTVLDTEAGPVIVVDRLDFSLRSGETLAIVGESGSGKSMTALSLMRLLPERVARIADGHVLFEGRDLVALTEAEMRRIRGAEIAMIFQEPMTSLNPVLRIGRQIIEVLDHRPPPAPVDTGEVAITPAVSPEDGAAAPLAAPPAYPGHPVRMDARGPEVTGIELRLAALGISTGGLMAISAARRKRR